MCQRWARNVSHWEEGSRSTNAEHCPRDQSEQWLSTAQPPHCLNVSTGQTTGKRFPGARQRWGECCQGHPQQQLCLRLFPKTTFNENNGRTSQYKKPQMEIEKGRPFGLVTNRREASWAKSDWEQTPELQVLALPRNRGVCLCVVSLKPTLTCRELWGLIFNYIGLIS